MICKTMAFTIICIMPCPRASMFTQERLNNISCTEKWQNVAYFNYFSGFSKGSFHSFYSFNFQTHDYNSNILIKIDSLVVEIYIISNPIARISSCNIQVVVSIYACLLIISYVPSIVCIHNLIKLY